MTRTARALIIGSVVGLGLWGTAVAAVPVEPTPVVAETIAARPPASEGPAEALSVPVLVDVAAPLLLAALCGTAMALLPTEPRHAARTRTARRRRRI